MLLFHEEVRNKCMGNYSRRCHHERESKLGLESLTESPSLPLS